MNLERLSTSNQQGSVLVVTLLILMAITILGIVSINTSSVELQITGNEKQMRESFYLAEAATVEGVQLLAETAVIDLNEQHLAWHHSRKALESQAIDFRDPDDWDVDQVEPDNGIPASVAENVFIAAVEWQVAAGSSLVATNSRLYVNRVYGLRAEGHADTMIEIGYKARY